MKVKELITELQKQDPGLTVTVDGYEGGVTEHIDIGVIKVRLNANEEHYFGEHELVSGGYRRGVNVLNLGRGER